MTVELSHHYRQLVQDQLRAGELRLGTGLRSTGTSLRFADDRGTVDPRTGVLTESLPGKLVYQENEDGQKVEVSLEDLTIVAKGAEARVMTTAMENGAALERFTYATFVALHPGTHLRRRARGPINTRRALP